MNEPCAENKHLIEYRIKLFLSWDVLLDPGAKEEFRTSCIERFWESYEAGCLTKHVILYENIGVTLWGPAYFWHQMYLRLENKTTKKANIAAGTEVGF